MFGALQGAPAYARELVVAPNVVKINEKCILGLPEARRCDKTIYSKATVGTPGQKINFNNQKNLNLGYGLGPPGPARAP